MTRSLIFLPLLLGTCACVSAGELAYGCGDLVVIGSVITLRHIPVSSDHPLGENRWDLRANVKQVLHGSAKGAIIPAIATSHGQMRSDKDFLIILTPSSGDRHTVRSASVWDRRWSPKLANPCS